MNNAFVQGVAGLFSNNEILFIMQLMRAEFESMLARLKFASLQDLDKRLKAYDHYHRFTLGRLRTRKISKPILEKRDFLSEDFASMFPDDFNQFPEAFTESNYPGIWMALKYSCKHLMKDVNPEDEIIVSIYCHRVLIRPGETYEGFCHRDNKGAHEKCGTAVWYPNVGTTPPVTGIDLYCYFNNENLTDDQIVLGKPDYIFKKEEYHNKVFIIDYPHNLIHGVRRGENRTPNAGKRKAGVADFLEPAGSDFVKDLVAISVSNEINAEE